jgi:hypothetical protein
MTTEPDGRDPEIIELPAPTAWPMVVALGIALAFGGLVTHAIVSVVGLVLALIGAVGWWREALPEPRVERIALPPVERRAPRVVTAPAAVERLRIGVGGHRTRVPVEVQPYSAGIWGGLVGGIAMAVLALAYGLSVQRSLWYPINLLAAVALPGLTHATLADLRAFNLHALVIGTIVHGLLSVFAGLLYAVILPMLPSRHMLWGGVVAPLLWTGLVWAVVDIVNPILGARVDWPWFVVSQMAFGLATGFVVARAHPLATMQTWSLAARAGVEASRPRPEGERDR